MTGLLLWLSLPLASAETVDRIAAVVNSEVITLSEVYDLASDFIQEREGEIQRRDAELEVLDVLIERSLVAQEIDRLELSVTEEELDLTIADIAGQNQLDEDGLKEELKRSGVLWEDYRDELSENLRDMKFNQVVLFPRLQISEDEIRDLYNRRVQALGSQGRRQLQGILLRASGSETPDALAALALRASELATLARDESWEQALEAAPDSLYASSGGEIGVFSAGELHEQMEATAFSLKKGEVSEPISLPAGLLILRLADIVASDLPDLELMRPDLENELRMSRLETEKEIWVQQARKQATVEVKLERLTP